MKLPIFTCLGILASAVPSATRAQSAVPTALQLPPIFGSNMMLQRDQPVPIWGQAIPGEEITVTFNEQQKSALASAEGQWGINLDPLPASKDPSTLAVTAKSGTKEFTNILVGEVWLCSGQSNMQATAKSLEIADEIRDAENPQIRLFTVPRNGDGSWVSCTTDSARTFSAAGYYFAVTLWNKLQVPVGVINASEGSSSIETWMPPETILANESLVDQNGARLIDEMKSFDQFHARYEELSAEERQRVFLKHSTGNYVFARSFLNPDGSLKPDVEASILFHMTVIKPAFYFRKFIACIQPYAIRGVLWYQGETNALTTGDPQYALKQKLLVEGWRHQWNEDDFPFYFVQIPPCESYELLPEFWLQQFQAAKTTPNSGLITTMDIGDLKDSHPKNKRDIGSRLALLALRHTYGKKDLVASGPVFKASRIRGNTVEISFENPGTGLTTLNGKSPDGFEVAGPDKAFRMAPAVISGDKIVITSPLQDTRYVRFAWSHTATPNLSNREGFPAAPFNTAEAFFN